jgi:hypothetical protein
MSLNLFARSWLLLLALLVPGQSLAQVYMLSEPVSRTVAVPLPVVGLTAAADLSWTSMNTFLLFAATGEPFSTAAFFAFEVATGVPSVAAVVRTENELMARWHDRRDLQAIADINGAREIRVLNTGYGEQTGIYTSRLHSSSFVFLEMEEGKIPPPVAGKQWIPVTDTDNTKIRFRLELPGGASHPTPLELSLDDLFRGSRVEQELLASWKASIQEWDRSRSLIDRHFRHKGLQELKVMTSMVVDGQEVVLGELSQGKGVNKLVGLTKIQRLKALLTGSPSRGRELWQTRNARIAGPGECSSWYSRLLGREFRARAPASPEPPPPAGPTILPGL